MKELGYFFVYFDGLNRFYVHADQEHLVESFGPGINVFDRAIAADYDQALRTIADLQNTPSEVRSVLSKVGGRHSKRIYESFKKSVSKSWKALLRLSLIRRMVMRK